MTNSNKGRAKSVGKKGLGKKDSPTNNQEQTTGKASDTQSWPHLKYEFLQPGKIKDNKRRSSEHPDYDPKTVYVPSDFLDKQTPVSNLFNFVLIFS